MGRVIRNNARTTTSTVFVPDAQSVALAASMAIATNTLSPMAVGVHSHGTRQGFTGDRGYGVNRFAGRTPPLQNFTGAARAVAHPEAYRLGIGAGVSGQPGLPGTGDVAGAGMYLGWTQLGRMGMGG